MKMRSVVLAGMAVLGFSSVCQAQQLYRWVDSNGLVHFSDQAPMPATHKTPHSHHPDASRACLKAQDNLELFKEGLWVNNNPGAHSGALNDQERKDAMTQIEKDIQAHCPLAKAGK